MLAKNNLIAFVGTADPALARTFYEETLGLKFVAEEPTALVFDANGRMLRISIVDRLKPQPFTVLGWQVGDIQQAIMDLTAKGISFEHFGFFEQDEFGIWQAGDGTLVAWFKDLDGNLLSLTQFPG